MKKLKTEHAHLHGITVHLPYVGKSTFGKDGTIEVEDHLVEKLMNDMPGFTVAKTQEELEQESKDAMIKELMTKKVDELKELCAGFPENEWENLNKKDLQNYIIGNL